jgi:hypothetical protein
LDMTLPTLSDISRCRPSTEFKMAATETGTGNNYWTEWGGRHDSNGYSCIFDHAEHVPNTPDIARRWLITGIQDGVH